MDCANHGTVQIIKIEIENLLRFGVHAGWLDPLDVIVARNALYDLFEIQEPDETVGQPLGQRTERDPDENGLSPAPILERLLDAAAARGMLETNTATYRDLLDARIMGLVVPRASEVKHRFWELVANAGIEQATDWFYQFSQQTNYIRMDRIAHNEYWTVATPFGKMEMTINLSKPEKDPQEIAALKEVPKSSYPKCALCLDNIGYTGRIDHPARQNHRVIPLELNGENWYLQYSPYVYYNEHCIIFSEIHHPMRIDRDTIERLLAFVERFPHYFAGSNADLPIVGGSILSHDHYQGGRHRFAMEKAATEQRFTHPDFPQIRIARVKWPLSVLRLSSANKRQLAALANHMLHVWRSYSDPDVEVVHETVAADGTRTPHNTITPIARINHAGQFELDIVLRNNRTTKEHPEGIFHPHRELHHIKKENIGLIEVMGLAVLPGRLQQELRAIAAWLVETIAALPPAPAADSGPARHAIERRLPLSEQDPLYPHAAWMRELALRRLHEPEHGTEADVLQKLYEEVGYKFTEVLGHSGVFKRDQLGREAFDRFAAAVGLEKS